MDCISTENVRNVVVEEKLLLTILLNCDRFSQVSWLVYVSAFIYGDIIRKKLERQDINNWG